MHTGQTAGDGLSPCINGMIAGAMQLSLAYSKLAYLYLPSCGASTLQGSEPQLAAPSSQGGSSVRRPSGGALSNTVGTHEFFHRVYDTNDRVAKQHRGYICGFINCHALTVSSAPRARPAGAAVQQQRRRRGGR